MQYTLEFVSCFIFKLFKITWKINHLKNHLKSFIFKPFQVIFEGEDVH